MVSKASEDFPLPERPVTTTMTSRGSETVTFFRLCSRAPRTTIWLSAILFSPSRSSLGKYTAPCQRAKGHILVYLDFIIRPYGFSSVGHPQSYIFKGACGGPLSCDVPREHDMILKEFSQILAEELGARRLAPGDASRPVRGLSVEEPAEGWLGHDEVAVTSREALDEGFLKGLGENGSPGVVWRSGAEPSPEAVELARALGLGLFMVPPEVPLRRLFSLFSGD